MTEEEQSANEEEFNKRVAAFEKAGEDFRKKEFERLNAELPVEERNRLEAASKGKIPTDPLESYSEKPRKEQSALAEPFLTGYPMIDAATGGFRPSNTYIVGGEQKSGKTGFNLKIVANCLERDIKVGYIDTELTQNEFDTKLAAAYFKAPQSSFKDSLLTPLAQLGEKAKLLEYASIHAKNDLKVNDELNLDLLLYRISEMAYKGCKAIFLDNITTITNFLTLGNNQAGWEVISEFINKAINLVKETDSVLFLSIHPKKAEQWQVTAGGLKEIIEKKTPQEIFKVGHIVVKRPLTQDLLASNSALSQISGYILIWRPFQNFEDSEFNKHSLILLNNFRHCPPAEIRMTFNGELGIFQRPTVEELIGKEVEEE